MFFTGLTVLSSVNLLNVAPLTAIPLSTAPLKTVPLNPTQLKCVSVNNQECRIRPEIMNVNSVSLYFIVLVLKQVNAVVVVTISMIHM